MTGWKLVPVEAAEVTVRKAYQKFMHGAEFPCSPSAMGEAVALSVRNAPAPPDEVLERMARAFIKAWQPKLGLMDEEMGEAVSAMRAALTAAEAT